MTALQVEILHRDGGYGVSRYRCAGGARPAADEHAPEHEVVLVLGGLFVVSGPRGRALVDRSRLLLLHRGEPFRVEHPDGGDDCLVLALPAGELLAAARTGGLAVGGPERPFDRLAVPLPLPAAAAARRLLAGGVTNPADGLAIEDRLLRLVGDALAGAAGGGEGRRVPPRPATLADWRDRVERVQRILSQQLGARLTMAALGRAVYCSPFHLARVFREVTGESIGAYRNRLRLQVALDRLAAGEQDLGGLAAELGYADHAHFTRAFRQGVGAPPSAYRERCGRAARRAVSARLAPLIPGGRAGAPRRDRCGWRARPGGRRPPG